MLRLRRRSNEFSQVPISATAMSVCVAVPTSFRKCQLVLQQLASASPFQRQSQWDWRVVQLGDCTEMNQLDLEPFRSVVAINMRVLILLNVYYY